MRGCEFHSRVAGLADGRAGLRDLGQRLVRWRVGPLVRGRARSAPRLGWVGGALVLGYVVEMIVPSDYERMWWLLFAVQSIAAVVVLLAERRRFTQKRTEGPVRFTAGWRASLGTGQSVRRRR